MLSVLLLLIITVMMGFTAYRSPNPSGKIYLYGEAHSVPDILDKEFQLWTKYYHEDGMRYLFIEVPFYDSEFLNLWMQSDSDELLDKM